MSSTVEMLNPTRAKLTITVPFAELTPAINKAYREVANQISLPGFRKGHVPPSLIDARVGRGVVLNEAVNAMLPDLYAEAIAEHQLTPLGRPEVELTKLEEGDTVEFAAEVDIVPEFALPDFSTIAVTVPPITNADQEVDARIGLLRERFAQVETVDRPAAKGDQVTLDLTGSQNGELLPDAAAQAVTYIVGSDQMLPGLDEAVTGCRAGEEKQFASTLLGGDHAGEAADIAVTVTAVQSRTLPEVTDEFAQLVSQFDTVAEMKADLKAAVEQRLAMDQLGAIRNLVLDEAIAKAGIQLPEAIVDAEVAERTAALTDQLKSAGITLEDYLNRMGDPAVRTAEQFEASTRTAVERGIKAELLLARVAEAKQVEVGQEDLTNLIFQKARENGTSPEQEVQHMQSHEHLTEWMAQIRQSKALDAIVAQSTVTDTTGRKVDVAAMVGPAA